MPHVELPQAEFKVVMLGDTFTGKTSLVLRFAEGYYREEGRSATVGAFFITKRLQVNGITCKIQIWDTAGQTQFRPMAPMYYKSAAAAIVCYDVSSPESYQTMRYWLDELHRNVPAGSIVIAIAATKSDLKGATPNSRMVPSSEAEEMANAMGAIFVDTSAKSNTNVSALFRRVAERVLQFRERARRDGTDLPGLSSLIPAGVSPGAIMGERGGGVTAPSSPSADLSVTSTLSRPTLTVPSSPVNRGATTIETNGSYTLVDSPSRNNNNSIPVVLSDQGLVDTSSTTDNGSCHSSTKTGENRRRSKMMGAKVEDAAAKEMKMNSVDEMVEPHEQGCGDFMTCGSTGNTGSSCVIS